MTAATYGEFLDSKLAIAPEAGFPDVSPDDVSPALKPHQRDAVVWAVRGGRRAIFASFGLGKTSMQLEAVRLTMRHAGQASRGLIVCPLGVKQEFVRDVRDVLGWQPEELPKFIRSHTDAAGPGIYMTNYESIREGKLDPTGFDVVSLDEAAILRGFGGTKTFREFMRLYEGSAAYRFVATATPSPNDYIELLAYAAFLDVIDVGQAKTRFFKRDSEHADNLTLLPHMEDEFWHWVASWALFLNRPSDLGYSDEGYVLPDIEVVWHEIPASDRDDNVFDRHGRGELFRDTSMGVQAAAAEKRDSIDDRVALAAQIINAAADGEHFLIWHDQEAERHAIAKAIPAVVSVWGSQPLEDREDRIIGFSDGDFPYLSTKPVIAGSGCNFQRHCHRAIFVGIGFKFADFIQAIHRIHRFGQTKPVRIDLIHTEAERSIRAKLERKWRDHERLVERMTQIVRKYGLAADAIGRGVERSRGVDRREVAGDGYRLVFNDTVDECASLPDASVGLIVTSIPFSTQYEYSPTTEDFGHNEDTAAFWQQMDYLTPNLLRVLKPGRVAAIHVKDRIVPGGINGLGFRTLAPFHAEAIGHYMAHGFAFLGMVTVVTDVVRENNQTYRLGYTAMRKDGSSVGVGVPEYVLLFRKPQTDQSKGFADEPIVKEFGFTCKIHALIDDPDEGDQTPCDADKPCQYGYSLARWQADAHGFWRTGGNRHLMPEEFVGLSAGERFRLFRDHYLANQYDYADHLAAGEYLAAEKQLPVDFMLLQPPSWHPDVWTDVARMRTLNMIQAAKGKEQHLCPLQFDVVDRIIERWSNPGDVVLDPFGGIMTVPYCALKLGRQGWGFELNPVYFRDGVAHVEGVAAELNAPTLFDLVAVEGAA